MARFTYYEGSDKLWYWRLRDGNNQIIATGAEGYNTEAGVNRAINNVKSTVQEITEDE